VVRSQSRREDSGAGIDPRDWDRDTADSPPIPPRSTLNRGTQTIDQAVNDGEAILHPLEPYFGRLAGK
jgi:hypothetical protein